MFLAAQSGNLFASGMFSREGYTVFAAYLAGKTFSHEKRKVFKNFGFKESRDLPW